MIPLPYIACLACANEFGHVHLKHIVPAAHHQEPPIALCDFHDRPFKSYTMDSIDEWLRLRT